jgi:hypothetical protein
MAKRRKSVKSRARSTKRKVSRKSYRRNPNLAATGKAYVGGLTGTPSKVMGLFKGRGAGKNILFTAGGLVGTYIVGGMVSRAVGGMLANVPVLNSPMGQRITGALFPYTIGFVGSRFVKDAKLKSALMVGGGIASIIELLMPGKVGELVGRIPGVSALQMGAGGAAAAQAAVAAEQGPVEGLGQTMLAGYVDAPSYAGTAGYVDAPSYAGTGEYVDAPGYSGTAGLGQEMLAGNYLEESGMFQPAI